MAISLTDGLRTGVRQGIRLSVAARSAYDAAAVAYFTAVEAADGQTLETGVKVAINNFIVGCKADGTWNAIKASCILAGARTLSGALVPLAGTAPTNFNFVSGDYNRKTGLAGNGSTKYLNSNRNNNADPQNNRHLAVNVSTRHTSDALYVSTATTLNGNGDSYLYGSGSGLVNTVKMSSSGAPPSPFGGTNLLTGFYGASRSASVSFVARRANANFTESTASSTPVSESLNVFGTAGFYSNSRINFYSIGESLDLALLDARVTALMNAISAAVQDPSYANVSLLLHGDGTNGSTTITDNSPSPKTVTAVGNAQISTAQSRFGGASIAFDGTGDSLTVPSSSDWTLGSSGNFTIECWVYPNGSQGSNAGIASTFTNWSSYGSRWALTINSLTVRWFDDIGNIAMSGSVSSAQWSHLAVSRSGSSIYLFINGTLTGTQTVNQAYATQERLIIGSIPGQSDFNGYIDDLRITKGVARYTANFIPPAAPFSDS